MQQRTEKQKTDSTFLCVSHKITFLLFNQDYCQKKSIKKLRFCLIIVGLVFRFGYRLRFPLMRLVVRLVILLDGWRRTVGCYIHQEHQLVPFFVELERNSEKEWKLYFINHYEIYKQSNKTGSVVLDMANTFRFCLKFGQSAKKTFASFTSSLKRVYFCPEPDSYFDSQRHFQKAERRLKIFCFW